MTLVKRESMAYKSEVTWNYCNIGCTVRNYRWNTSIQSTSKDVSYRNGLKWRKPFAPDRLDQNKTMTGRRLDSKARLCNSKLTQNHYIAVHDNTKLQMWVRKEYKVVCSITYWPATTVRMVWNDSKLWKFANLGIQTRQFSWQWLFRRKIGRHRLEEWRSSEY